MTPVETTSAPVATTVDEPSFLVRHQFIIYRLFSLCGLVPVGAYVVVHLLTNASIVNGPMTFQEQVNRIHSLGVVLPLVEWTFIFIPLIFHATVGWLIIAGAMPNTNSYPYASNIRYTLQRATAIIAFVFILIHVIQLHHLAGAPFKEIGDMKFGAQFDPHHAASSTAIALRPLVDQGVLRRGYAVGRLSLCQRAVDPGHHLGAVDQRRRSAPGKLGERRRRAVSGHRGPQRPIWHVDGERRHGGRSGKRHGDAAEKNCSSWNTRPSLPRPRRAPTSTPGGEVTATVQSLENRVYRWQTNA